MSKPIKAGWVEAPCTIIGVEGKPWRNVAMKVTSIERNVDDTTFFGQPLFNGQPKLTLPNWTIVSLM